MEDVNPFAALDAEERLRNDPKTAGYMSDPMFAVGIRELAKDYKALQR